MSKERKKFAETGIGKFLVDKAPKLLDTIDDFVPPLKVLTSLIINDPDMTPEQKAEAVRMANEHEKELYEIEVRDRESARNREVELAKAGKMDWMMKVVGLSILLMFFLVVIAVLFVDLKNENMAHLIVGEILGFVGGIVFYYFGTSKSSSDKNKHTEEMSKAIINLKKAV